MQINRKRLYQPLAAALAGAFLLAACGGGQQQGQQGAAPQATPVGVITVQSQSVPLVTELPGRTNPYLIAEVRPQVTGIVKKRAFNEGGEVKAGELLYQIDPATYQATYDSAKAALARAEANVYSAKLMAERYADLVKVNAVSRQANDDAIAALKQAEADVASSRASVDSARINLDFTRVTAPVSGRIGRSAVTAGALVTANQETALAVVRQLDPIYVDVTQSSTEMLALRRQFESGNLKRNADQSVPVKLVLEDGSEYAASGKLAFSEVSVDEGTGSVVLRAVFPNAKNELLPGMYVRARIEQGVRGDAILVPHAAVSRDAKGGALVMVVNAENKVEARPVKAERALSEQWVISEGLKAGERVIVEGLQKVRPGAPVQPQDVAAAPAAAPAAAAAAK
ncbi:efflux RND transporter periplasmic adaptor subunit [Azoarcus indigens]|uniref:Membrane fusion protein (Multidrug efflux system) n=1 Tax=Azoarcus indigens TaxID=29545 RepID=A0A4R6DMM0_9RHOO|nr:efflux RND transporter periplasmic adaptor subunit [Azoarcus indigens]NMG66150.1 efflux RND transporter periplasmic adaptor subunit [Azoarcus indigens]TDN45569.1 membrane fusion protein (multidrug efflux system) [Azoarcus indigens]